MGKYVACTAWLPEGLFGRENFFPSESTHPLQVPSQDYAVRMAFVRTNRL